MSNETRYLVDYQRSGEPTPPTLVRALRRLHADGFTPSEGACYLRADGSAYAASVETRGAGTHGHPAHAVEIDATGQMWIRNRKAE